VFMHPIAAPEFERRFRGNGGLVNVIGNPLETTIAITHLIFEGTLDRFPGLKLCTSHAGGYIGSYGDRSDAGCVTFPDRCKSVQLKKKPTEYLKDLYYDTIIFTPETTVDEGMALIRPLLEFDRAANDAAGQSHGRAMILRGPRGSAGMSERGTLSSPA